MAQGQKPRGRGVSAPSRGKSRTHVARATQPQPKTELFQSLLEHAADLVHIIDAEGRIRYVSPAVTRLLGYAPDDVLHTDSFSFVHPDDEPRLRAVVTQIVEQGGTSERQAYRLRHHDGSLRVFEGTVTNLLDDPTIAGILINARDSTDRKEDEQLLRASDERYRQLMELLPTPSLVHVDGKIVYVNAATLALLGAQSAEELLGKTLRDFVHPDYHHLQQQRIQQILTSGRAVQFLEFKFLRLDGQVIEAEAAGVAITYGGKPAVQTVIRDLTTHKRDEQALRASEERYRNLFENANDAIAAFTVEGTLTEVNTGASVLLGWTRGELVGQSYDKVLTPAARATAEDRTRRYLAGEDMPSIFEAELVRKDGTTIPVEARTRPIHDRQGNLLGFQGIFRDIRERQRAERELRESQRLQERIADILPEILYLYDVVEQRMLYVNHRILTVLGYPPEHFKEKIGPLFDDILHPEDRARFTTRIAKLATAADDRIIETECRLQHANGEWRTLHWREQVCGRTGSGATKQILGTGQDVTDRKRLVAHLGAGILDKKTIGARVRDLRKQLDLTQSEFGVQFGGFNQRQIFSYESGEADVPLTLLLAIHARGYPLEQVLGTGTKAIAETTIQYFSATYRARLVLQRLIDTAAQLLGRDQETVEQALIELGIPLKTVTPEQRKLFEQLTDIDKLAE
ncbi:MAG: PAS domain S-box protein [Deltaproteobacteria bacterium]|nr:PAS domain S-box protein [Deltaproteobacteria bacterium]